MLLVRQWDTLDGLLIRPPHSTPSHTSTVESEHSTFPSQHIKTLISLFFFFFDSYRHSDHYQLFPQARGASVCICRVGKLFAVFMLVVWICIIHKELVPRVVNSSLCFLAVVWFWFASCSLDSLILPCLCCIKKKKTVSNTSKYTHYMLCMAPVGKADYGVFVSRPTYMLFLGDPS